MGMRQLGAMDMDMALLDAGRQSGKHLAGIEQALDIKSAFDPALLRQIFRGELVSHQVAFFDADAVLA